MKIIQVIGLACLWIGFFSAALASVFRYSEASNKWLTIPWPWYGISMAVGVVGILFLRTSSKAAAAHSDRVDLEFSTLTSSLELLTSRVAELVGSLKKMAPHHVVEFIDEQLAEPFSDFADSRNALIQRFGMQGFADVMTQFASGERFVNRSWSAAADGYMGEVSASLDRAQGHLEKARQLMLELDK